MALTEDMLRHSFRTEILRYLILEKVNLQLRFSASNKRSGSLNASRVPQRPGKFGATRLLRLICGPTPKTCRPALVESGREKATQALKRTLVQGITARPMWNVTKSMTLSDVRELRVLQRWLAIATVFGRGFPRRDCRQDGLNLWELPLL